MGIRSLLSCIKGRFAREKLFILHGGDVAPWGIARGYQRMVVNRVFGNGIVGSILPVHISTAGNGGPSGCGGD
jgi:hypothetical protein